MELQFHVATQNDLDEVTAFYKAVTDALMMGENLPGWRSGIYPNEETAIEGIQNGGLLLVKKHDKIIGSMIVSHKGEPVYEQVKWQSDLKDADVYVLYTVAIHPSAMRSGIASAMLRSLEQIAKQRGIKALRLDVAQRNEPAIRLYERNGFQRVATVSLGLEAYGLDTFYLYEKLL